MKKKLLVAILIIAVLAFCAITLASLYLKDLFLKRGLEDFEEASRSYNKKGFEKAVSSLELALLFNRFSVFDHSHLSETYYNLGLSNLYLRNNEKANSNLSKAKKTLSKEDEYVDAEELESKLLQSLVKVEGIIDGDNTIVNRDIAIKGDLIKGVEIVQITKHYVVFKYGDKIFSDSIDKYNPLSKKERDKCLKSFSRAQKCDNPGFASCYYTEARMIARNTLHIFDMDLEQTNQMQQVINKCEKEISRINAEIEEAGKRGKIIAGMKRKDVEAALGKPIEKKKMIRMNNDEKWIYADKVLYFKNDLRRGVKGILVNWENR